MNFALGIIEKNRKILYKFLNEDSLENLNTIPKGFNNNIFWNIAHVVVTQELLVYNLSGLPMMVNDDLVTKYKKGTRPEALVTQEEVDEIKGLLFSTFNRLVEDYNNGKFENYTPYTTSTNTTIGNAEEAIAFNLFHEGIHLGYILALKRVI